MGAEYDFFGSSAYLEPKCPGCGSKIEYGITTEYDEKNETHRCLGCSCILK